MDSGAPIFDISSDEEAAFEAPGVCDDDYNWLTEVLENFDKKTDDDSDEVVVVGVYNPPKPKSKSRLKLSKPVKVVEDDDCVVLDGDPDKSGAVIVGAAGDGDDVLVVGEKGQIACRDYPHPRHICAKFPFSSTQHDRHCDLCHCYVCDSLAPCAYWGTGVSSIDHCHATDKQEMWKNQRENSRQMKNAQLLRSKFTDNPLPAAVTQINQNVPLEIAQLGSNSIPQNQLSRPTAVRACSSTRLGVQNIINGGRNWQPRRLQQAFGIQNRVIQQHRGPNLGNIKQQYVHNNAKFRRAVQGAPLMHRSVYGSSNGLNAPATHPVVSTTSLATRRNKSPAGGHNIMPNIDLESYVQSLSQCIRASTTANSLPSQPAGCSQPVPQLTDGQSNNLFGNRSQTAVMDPSLFDLDFGWIDNLGVINQQMPVENSKYEGSAFNNEPSTVDSQLSEGCRLMKDNEYESWTLGQSVPVTPEGGVATNPDVFSPEPPAIDTGMLYFDFETSWNGLAHA